MANEKAVSRTIKGIITDVHPMNLDELSFGHVLNGVAENFDGNGFPMIQNEPSNLLCTNMPEGFKVVGFANIIEQNRVIWFLKNDETGESEIGETQHFNNCRDYAQDGIVKGCDDCISVKLLEDTPLEDVEQSGCCFYTPIDNQDCFNFSTKFPIAPVVYRILECSLQIFFADDNNPRRWLEFEYVDDDPSKGLVIKDTFREITGFEDEPCEIPIYNDHIDCNKMGLQPAVDMPCIEFIDLVSGGSNKAGVYQFFVAFADKNGSKRTSYVSSTNPIPIRTKDVTFATDYATDRAIALQINNLDRFGPFEFYKLAVAKTINGFTSFYEVGTYPITQTKIYYTGNQDAEIKLTEGDIFQRVPFYSSARSVTASNNILFWAGLKSHNTINVQRIANNVRLQWQTIAIPEAVYKNPRNVNKFRSFMRDEVYPAGIVFIVDDGEELSAAHVPGRSAELTDLEIIDNDDSIVENNCDDCVSAAEPDEQITIEDCDDCGPASGTECECDDESDIELILDNSVQASACEPVPVDVSGCEPAVGTGTPPVVDAGLDQTINYIGPVGLFGTATATLPNVVTAVLWTQLSGPTEVVIANPNTLTTFFTGYDVGTYIFQLCVTDSGGNIVADTVEYDMTIPANVPPVADPGADKIVVLPTTDSFLNGSGSTDENGIASYAWTFVGGPATPTITDPTVVYTTVTGLTLAGTYIFQLTVTDIRGCSSTATTIIYVIEDPCDSVPCCAHLLYPVNQSLVSSSENVTLQWNAATCADSYDIYLKEDGGGYAFVANTEDTNYILTSLNPNTIYHWYVVPKNDAGEAVDCDECFRTFITPVESVVNTCEKLRWEVYNTGTIEGGDLEVYKECEETCYQYGNFSYWESTELYPMNPEVWGDLCGMPIRHHKFPDSLITHIHDREDATQDYTMNNIVYPIGFKVDHASVVAAIATAVAEGAITQEQADRIVGYRVVRGNRFRNKSIVAKGLIFDMNQYRRKMDGEYFDNQDIYFANYPYNDLRSNPFVTDDFENYDTHNQPEGPDLPFTFSKRYTFHSPDTHFSEPTVGTKLKLETVEYGQSEGYFTKSDLQARQRFLSNTSYFLALAAGIVAALLQTEEKEEATYTAKGNIISAMGVASGTLGPFLPFTVGAGAAFAPYLFQDAALYPSISTGLATSTEFTKKTVQGKYSDWFNPVFIVTEKPALIPLIPILLLNTVTSFMSKVLFEANIVIKLIESLTPFRDWTVQYHSVGKYNAYSTIDNAGNKIRSITASAYLKSENSLVNEESSTVPGQFSAIKINNWNRESSLYLRYNGTTFPTASSFVEDQSRYTLEDVDCVLDRKTYAPVSSYYASIKNFVPDQYGSIFDIDYVNTDSCPFDIGTSNDDCRGVYGGDTFINRFALKIKVPYFLADTFRLPDGTDFNFELYPNLGVPRHYYNSTLGVGSEIDSILDILSIVTPAGAATFLGRPKSIRDCDTNKFFYQNGYIYLYHYGIPYFFVESDVNVDYRHAENLKEKAFYPVQSDLDFWLQQENVLISEDNYYFYNSDYSKQNKETPIVIDPVDFEPNRDCRSQHGNRIIYALDANWLTYKANDFYDVPLNKGTLISIDGIENETVLIRTTNSTSVFKAFNLIPTDGDSFQVGSGGVFKNKPQQFAETTLGYLGTQSRAILHTEYGHIWPDTKRGQVFNVGAGGNKMDEISKDGMKNWFKENLPFRILRDFKNMPEDHVDNSFNGVGVCMAFDKRFNRFLLTKRDFKRKDKDVLYNPDTREFYKLVDDQPVTVSIYDGKYFKECSWTVSYNFFTKSWISYHSYRPAYYIDFIDFFGSGDADGLWLHDITNASYQVFYGKLYPFIAEYITKFSAPLRNLTSMIFDTEVRRYRNESDYVVRSKVPGFNQAIIYNDLYNSGLLELVKTNKNDLSQTGVYPIKGFGKWDVEVNQKNYQWRFNQFFNLIRDNSEVPHWTHAANNVDKTLNPLAFNYKKTDFTLGQLKGQWFKARFINNKESRYKVISKFTIDTLNIIIN